MLKFRIAILRKVLVKYELSILTKDTTDVRFHNLIDVANACKDLANSIDEMLKKKKDKECG